jgi:hypothetical protein
VEHLSPQRRRLRTLGAGEIVEHARGRVLEQAVPERVEAIDDLFDQRPGARRAPMPLHAALRITTWRAIRASLKALILGAVELRLLAERAWLSGRAAVSTEGFYP